MKKFLFVALLGFLCTAASVSLAGPFMGPSRYGEWIRVNNNGVITYRYVYRGYRSGFPPPALYYYGYPQSGYTYGTGF